jgi:hypothetical protein
MLLRGNLNKKNLFFNVIKRGKGRRKGEEGKERKERKSLNFFFLV